MSDLANLLYGRVLFTLAFGCGVTLLLLLAVITLTITRIWR
jgi:hypothetical protein